MTATAPLFPAPGDDDDDDGEVYPAPSQTYLVLLLAPVLMVVLHRPLARVSARSEQLPKRSHLRPARLAHADLPI